MMFWKSSSSTASASTPRNSLTTSSDNGGVAPAAVPSYVLSEQRRNELLLAARANRVSWIDGVDEPARRRHSAGQNGEEAVLSSPSLNWKKGNVLATHAGTSIPLHCQQALETIATDLQEFFEAFDELKDKIIPNSIISERALEGGKSSSQQKAALNGNALPYRTIFQDLHENEALLEKWQRTQGHGVTSPVRRKRLTGDDKENVFLLAYRELISVLKNPKAAELVYQIQSFVKKFDAWDLKQMSRQRLAHERPGGHIQAFIDKLVQQLRHNGKLLDFADNNNPLAFLGGDDDWSEDLLHEVLEAFLMEKVYAKALTPSLEAEIEDRNLYNRLQSLVFVDFRHLDLPEPETEETRQAWHQLVIQLRQLSLYMSPRRKMDCILRICQELTKLLASQKTDGRFPSADEFLPGLIYLLLKANPHELKRNVDFILEYRNPSKLVSEPGYFFTHLVSSVAFLEQVNGSLLTISPEEFEEGLRKSKQQMIVDIETSSSEQDAKAQDKTDKTEHNAPKKDDSYKLPDVLEVRAERLATLASLK
ncbi:Vacuolar assembly/sorting protein vps9, partial [Globisporangium splendens]